MISFGRYENSASSRRITEPISGKSEQRARSCYQCGLTCWITFPPRLCPMKSIGPSVVPSLLRKLCVLRIKSSPQSCRRVFGAFECHFESLYTIILDFGTTLGSMSMSLNQWISRALLQVHDQSTLEPRPCTAMMLQPFRQMKIFKGFGEGETYSTSISPLILVLGSGYRTSRGGPGRVENN